MSKKRLDYFYSNVLPELMQHPSLIPNQITGLFFDHPMPKCFIKRNNKIEESYIYGIQIYFGTQHSGTPFVSIGCWYRWAEDYGRTWALKKEDFK